MLFLLLARTREEDPSQSPCDAPLRKKKKKKESKGEDMQELRLNDVKEAEAELRELIQYGGWC